MNLIERVATAVSTARKGWQIAGSGLRPVTMSESDMTALTNEMDGFTMIGSTPVDLDGWNQTKMQKVALHIYRHNHMGKRLLEIIVDFVLGDGQTVVAKHEDDGTKEKIQEVLDDFWKDPINEMERLNPQRLLELNLWGEVLMPVMVNKMTGKVRLGWIDPSNILEIEPDPVTKRPGRVKLTQDAAKEVGQEWLNVIRYSHADGAIVGDCFYHQINSVLAARRGISEFFTSGDWFDILDETMKVQADRAKVLMEFIWDVKLEGADDLAIKQWLKTQKRPKPGSIRAHNEKVEWKATAPSLAAYEASRHTKDLKTYILGGFGYPNHWFGSGDDANLATAEMMSEPTRKALKRKTAQFNYLMKDVCRFVIYTAVTHPKGALKGSGVDPLSDCFDINVPDIGGPDVAKVGSALQAIVTAITQALADGLVSEDTARAMFAAVASLTGIDIDPTEEAEKIDADRQKKADEQAAVENKMNDQIQKHLDGMKTNPSAPKPEVPAAAEV